MISKPPRQSTGQPSTTKFRMARKRIAVGRRAMTLIELMVSAVLASVMMAALAGIVWSSARETGTLRREAQSHFPVTQLARQLRFDFVNARGMRIDAQGVTLHGFLGTDRPSRRPLFTPAQVRYEISRLGNHLVLLRATEDHREPVWFGCRSLQIETLELPDPESEAMPQAEAGGLPEIPSRFRVTMTDQDGRVLWREVIHHHDN